MGERTAWVVQRDKPEGMGHGDCNLAASNYHVSVEYDYGDLGQRSRRLGEITTPVRRTICRCLAPRHGLFCTPRTARRMSLHTYYCPRPATRASMHARDGSAEYVVGVWCLFVQTEITPSLVAPTYAKPLTLQLVYILTLPARCGDRVKNQRHVAGRRSC